jgi:hypothetical protein
LPRIDDGQYLSETSAGANGVQPVTVYVIIATIFYFLPELKQ